MMKYSFILLIALIGVAFGSSCHPVNTNKGESASGACFNACNHIGGYAYTPDHTKDCAVDNKIGRKASYLQGDCRAAYIRYDCARNFPECDVSRQNALPVCKEICEEFFEACKDSAILIPEQDFLDQCDFLPSENDETCTNSATRMAFSAIAAFVALAVIVF